MNLGEKTIKFILNLIRKTDTVSVDHCAQVTFSDNFIPNTAQHLNGNTHEYYYNKHPRIRGTKVIIYHKYFFCCQDVKDDGFDTHRETIWVLHTNRL